VGSVPLPIVQTKLEVGPPNDQFEQEAERVADQVMRMADLQRAGPLEMTGVASPNGIQRLCAECKEEVRRQPADDEEEELQMKRASGATPEIGPGVQAQISRLHGSGQPLSPAQRTFFESRFGHDFGQVRLHTDQRAAASARALNALAYTVGTHIVFGSGQFATATSAGRRLLAHELTHVVQQDGGRAPAVQRQAIQPACNGLPYDPARQCCCHYRVIPGPCAPPGEGCVDRTTRDNEFDGCSVPAWLEDPEFKDNPGLARDTWFSDRRIHGTQAQDSFDPQLPCDVHDKCYQTCSGNPEAHWRACDQQLVTDADAVCERHRVAYGEDYNYARCKDAVLKARALLPRGSWGAFEQRQREYCACCPPPDVRDSLPIHFDTDSDEPDGDEIAALKLFVEQHRALLASGACDVALIGYASRIGSDEYNLDLSQRRISAVRKAINDELSAKLIHVDEFPLGEKEAESEKRPEEDDSPEDRRVDITIAGHL
jgi:outer membrane protein OmpA-like peptidoglycan-associated protein